MLALGKKLTNKYIVLVFYRFNDFSFFLLFIHKHLKKKGKKKEKLSSDSEIIQKGKQRLASQPFIHLQFT